MNVNEKIAVVRPCTPCWPMNNNNREKGGGYNDDHLNYHCTRISNRSFHALLTENMNTIKDEKQKKKWPAE